ncbi:hypothetical protein POVWA1_040370 [Plasmodium ovale wallikeri]|uniref:Uncharacterized protein n=1 Tax=Plasmodium ovale wallikeri TaxID=864142 RepID=A0A1A8Z779_PLAOA|nr:hypothetical protein POVWA1_040370 [Plasmodium ovale wallikeri]
MRMPCAKKKKKKKKKRKKMRVGKERLARRVTNCTNLLHKIKKINGGNLTIRVDHMYGDKSEEVGCAPF